MSGRGAQGIFSPNCKLRSILSTRTYKRSSLPFVFRYGTRSYSCISISHPYELRCLGGVVGAWNEMWNIDVLIRSIRKLRFRSFWRLFLHFQLRLHPKIWECAPRNRCFHFLLHHFNPDSTLMVTANRIMHLWSVLVPVLCLTVSVLQRVALCSNSVSTLIVEVSLRQPCDKHFAHLQLIPSKISAFSHNGVPDN